MLYVMLKCCSAAVCSAGMLQYGVWCFVWNDASTDSVDDKNSEADHSVISGLTKTFVNEQSFVFLQRVSTPKEQISW